jgi:hypothetical protein
MLSLAVAVTVTVPDTVPATGAVIDTDGSVVSGVKVVALAAADGLDTFPAASKAATV